MSIPVIILNSSPAIWGGVPFPADAGLTGDAGNRRDVADKIEIEPFVERRVDRIRCANHEERMAVGRRTHDRLGCDIGPRARPVVDDEWLAEPLRQPLTHQAREDVLRAAGGTADDKTHQPRRIGLRPCDPRRDRESGGACCQMQKLTAPKFHGVASLKMLTKRRLDSGFGWRVIHWGSIDANCATSDHRLISEDTRRPNSSGVDDRGVKPSVA